MKKTKTLMPILAGAAVPILTVTSCTLHFEHREDPEPEPVPDVVCDNFNFATTYFLRSSNFSYNNNDTFIFEIDTSKIPVEWTQPLESIYIMDSSYSGKVFSIQWFLVDGEKFTSSPSTYEFDSNYKCMYIYTSFGDKLRNASSVLGQVQLSENALNCHMLVWGAEA